MLEEKDIEDNARPPGWIPYVVLLIQKGHGGDTLRGNTYPAVSIRCNVYSALYSVLHISI